VGLGREEGNRKDGGKISAMTIESGNEDTLIYGKGRTVKRKVELESRKEGVGIREKIRKGKGRGVEGNERVRECLEEIRERFKEERVLTRWKRERKRFFEEIGVKRVEVEEKNREEENWINKIEERDKERQREKRWERIKGSKYNK